MAAEVQPVGYTYHMEYECSSCPAKVIFVRSAKSGKPMILDAKPVKGVVIGHTDGAGAFRLTEHSPAEPMARAKVINVYTDHHVTCPNAKDWQGRTRADPP